MNDKQLHKELQLRTGVDSIENLANKLFDLLETEPSFAIAAIVDTLEAFKTLLKQHTNADEDAIDIAGCCFYTAITNAASTDKATILHCNPDERIVDTHSLLQ